jgi:hypothetical protein
MPADTVSAERPSAAAPPPRPALAPMVWIPLLIVVIGVLLWLVTR